MGEAIQTVASWFQSTNPALTIGYLRFALTALVPVLVSVILYLLDKKTSFGKLSRLLKQAIFGIVFGGLAILGTHFGINISGAQMNCRDAAVMTAGLMFGAPAGIIAGVIGALERWLATELWGIGAFTQLACTVSTLLAGIYSVLLRKFMFEDRRPSALLSLASGLVIETFHMAMVFLTNMSVDTPKAIYTVKVCTIPMVSANGISVMLASLALWLLSRKKKDPKRSGNRISQTIQRWLGITVVAAFLITSLFVFRMQDTIADRQANTLLNLAVDEVAADISDASDRNLLGICHQVAGEIRVTNLQTIAKKYDVAEISVINEKGVIVGSTESRFVGFDMDSGDQSRAFLCLLHGEAEFVQEYGPIAFNDGTWRKYAGVRLDGGGFVQVGYDFERFHTDIDSEIFDITQNRHVGETGFILILGEYGDVLSAPKILNWRSVGNTFELPADYQIPMLLNINDIISKQQDETFGFDMGSVHGGAQYRMTEGYCIFAFMPQVEILQMRNVVLYVNTFMEILAFAVLFALIYLLIKMVIVDQIKKINRSLSDITGGDLNVVVNVRQNAEFAALSDDINSTVNTLKRYIDEASARIDKELEFAKNIQRSALPGVFPAFPKRNDFDIYALMDPAKEVGGDFYDFYMNHRNTLHFLVADVSGKGIPAAMFMMRAKTELKRLTEEDHPLNEVFTAGNAALCEGNDAGMFVTAWQGSIDLKTGLLHYANAGHNPPLICRGGKFEYLRSRAGFVLGGMEDIRYRINELQLAPGDIVFLYTDGVTEATNSASELFGEERLLETLNARSFESMEKLCKTVKEAVDGFVGEADQFDDITMVAFRYFGEERKLPSIFFERAKLEDITEVTAFVEEKLNEIGCPTKVMMQIDVAIDELFSNIVRYGYPEDVGPVTVEVEIPEDQRQVSIRFIDKGIPYNPLQKEDPDVTLSADERSIGGLGIYMVKKTMDDVDYCYEYGENRLTITKRLEK